jgi:membrane protein YqaA with SNARE-associated domain
MADLSIYGGLFVVALVAATIFPLQSEALLVGLLLHGGHPAWLLVAVASVGNIAGSTINWVLGRWIARNAGIVDTGAGRCCFRGRPSLATRSR